VKGKQKDAIIEEAGKVLKIVSDYWSEPSLDSIEQWLDQFDEDLRLKLISEMRHILSKSYLSHPADDARMRAMLYALRSAGFNDESSQVLSRWQSFLAENGVKPEPEYHRCYPDTILQTIAEHAKQGLARTQVRIATPTSDPVHSLLNQAWDLFWTAPDCYVSWERKAVVKLFEGMENRKSPNSSLFPGS
jgi:hypothetical protein